MDECGDKFGHLLCCPERVTSATLVIPRFITCQLFDSEGRILDKRLETMQSKCSCAFRLSRMRPDIPGSKIYDRLLIKYDFPTKNHEVTIRLFNALAHQCGNSIKMVPFIKVCRVERMPFDSVLKEAAERAVGEENCNNRARSSRQIAELYKQFLSMTRITP